MFFIKVFQRFTIAFIIGVAISVAAPSLSYAANFEFNVYDKFNKIYSKAKQLVQEKEYQEKINSVMESAESYLGVPYVWGGSSPSGFDCSGLVQYVYAECGISLPRTTYGQIECGEPMPLDSLTLGDLLFWDNYHVAIYIGDGKYIHAPSSGQNVKVSQMKYWCPNSTRRIIQR